MLLVADGDENAFSCIYQRYSKRLLHYFSKLLQYNREKAEDMLHDLFIKVMERPELFNGSSRFSTWIYQVATNMCRNEWRNQATRSRILEEQVLAGVTLEEPARFAHDLDKQVLRKEINQLYQQLNETEKCVFLLRFQYDLPLKEIAQVLDCPEGTIKSRCFYLLKKFAAHLKNFHPKQE